MMHDLPKIIQGGMGAGVSNWILAHAVSTLGQLGVVSGTGLDQILARRLQEGDPGEHMRRALEHFPYRDMAKRILDAFFIPGGKPQDVPYKRSSMHTVEGNPESQELLIVANFAEVFLAREGHKNPVGINYLDKITIPHLPSIYGAMLAGVAVIIMGAGIPVDIPAALDALALGQPATYRLHLANSSGGETYTLRFDPARYYAGGLGPATLHRPDFYPIVSSVTLAGVMARKASGKVNGFVVEGSTAGGHNAPPRGLLKLTEQGEPIYSEKDAANLEGIKALGLPFWLAGGYGSAAQLSAALASGAAGVQVGSAFALCTESGLAPQARQALILKALAGKARVFTDPVASPTGFPFKVAELEGSLSEAAVYEQRNRICDLGFLREAYRDAEGTIRYRCAAEPVNAYVRKGGDIARTVGRKCLCNALVANIGMPQLRPNNYLELPLVTLGDDYLNIARFCPDGRTEFSAGDIIRQLLG